MTWKAAGGALGALLAGAIACELSNPKYQDSEGGSSGTSGASLSGTSEGTTSSSSTASTSATGTGTSTSGTITTSTSTSTSRTSTTSTSTTSMSASTGTSTGESTGLATTGEPLPDPLIIPATIAVCVLVGDPYGPPALCEDEIVDLNATAQLDLLGVDMALNNGEGDGRLAEVALAFPLPAELADVTLVSARLELQTADGRVAASADGGRLWTAAPFTAMSLESAAPSLDVDLEVPLGAVTSDAPITAEIPISAVTGDALYLALVPASSDTAIYQGLDTGNAPPRLVIDLE
ncbi:MAG: hypothetical protein R3B09_12750 [Nannocystaceae bacterium]